MADSEQDQQPKSIIASKTFWVNVIPAVAAVVGHFWPPLGDFLRDNAVPIAGALGTLNVGLRTMTSEPVTFSVSKKF